MSTVSMSRVKIIFSFILVSGCSDKYYQDFFLNEITSDQSAYNGYLIERSDGLYSLDGISVQDSSFGILLVHGYYPLSWPKKGYEWTKAILKLAGCKRSIWWLKHNWNECPEKSANRLDNAIDSIVSKNKQLDSLWIIGHSYGGLIVSDIAEKWNHSFPLSVHAIAAPLSGSYERLNACQTKGKTTYTFSPSVKYTQWKTDHMSDGAFKKLEMDPQDVSLNNGVQIQLPKTWKDNRLGHNRSIQYVIDFLIEAIDPVLR